MNFFQRRKVLKATDALDLVPVRTVGHVGNGDTIRLVVPKFEHRLIHLVYPSSREMFYRVKLDKTGSLAWKYIDGDRSIKMIASQLRVEYHNDKESLVGIEERLVKFMTMLYGNRYISFRQVGA